MPIEPSWDASQGSQQDLSLSVFDAACDRLSYLGDVPRQATSGPTVALTDLTGHHSGPALRERHPTAHVISVLF